MKLFSVVSAILSLVVVVGAQLLAAWYAINLALAPLGRSVIDASTTSQVIGGVAAYCVARLVSTIVVAAHDSTSGR